MLPDIPDHLWGWQVRVGADTEAHDLDVKLKAVRGFVDKNFRVKLVVRFKRWRSSDGAQRLKDLVNKVAEWSTVTAPQANEKLLRNTVAVYLTPKLAPIPKPEVQQPSHAGEHMQNPAKADAPKGTNNARQVGQEFAPG